MTQDKRLIGKTAVVTGAGRGIGRAIALAFAREGADVAICARSEDQLSQTQKEIEKEGVASFSASLDVSSPEDTKRFCQSVLSKFGRIDILVNNAGAYLDQGSFEASDPDAWWTTVAVNVRGPYLMTRHLLAGMNDGAKIINLSSGKGYSAGVNSSSYHVSKAGLNMLTNALANELWPRKIDVNTLIPGPTATVTFSREDPNGGSTPEAILERLDGNLPKGLPEWERVKHPDEVADMAVTLATQPMGGPTGQIFSLARRPL